MLTGLVYPLAMTAFAQVAFTDKADGSLVEVDGQPVGSSLIGQQWEGAAWFYGRPSAVDDDASTSSGRTSARARGPRRRHRGARCGRSSRSRAVHPGLTAADIPVDLLTASASGLDPDISVEAARFQAPRIAAVRGLSLEQVRR